MTEVGLLEGDLPTSEVSILVKTQRLLGSNFSEKPPSPIGGWGPNGMAGGEQGKGQGWLRGGGILGNNAEFNCTVGGQHQPNLHSPGRGKAKAKEGDKGNGKGTERRAENLKPLSHSLEENSWARPTEVFSQQGVLPRGDTCLRGRFFRRVGPRLL